MRQPCRTCYGEGRVTCPECKGQRVIGWDEHNTYYCSRCVNHAPYAGEGDGKVECGCCEGMGWHDEPTDCLDKGA